MATRSSWIADGIGLGAGNTSIYTCPDGVTALVKYVSFCQPDSAPGTFPPAVYEILHQRAGADLIPIQGFVEASNPASQFGIWFALDEGDEIIVQSDGSFPLDVGVYGALLPAAP